MLLGTILVQEQRGKTMAAGGGAAFSKSNSLQNESSNLCLCLEDFWPRLLNEKADVVVTCLKHLLQTDAY